MSIGTLRHSILLLLALAVAAPPALAQGGGAAPPPAPPKPNMRAIRKLRIRFERDVTEVRAFPYLHLPWLYFNRFNDSGLNVKVMATWDLSRLVFDRRQLPHFGRIERNLAHWRRDITARVHRLYNEYRSIAQRLVQGPAASLIVREFERIRLQEIAAFFDGISNGYWSKATGGIP